MIASGEHADPGADRLRQDARRLPLRDRPPDADAPGAGLRVLYVSPLKALNYDVERNLRGPLAGLQSQLRVAVRTGDTPQKERAAMLRNAPDILITTPESLFLLLTSQARELLRTVDTLILDEVHAVAGTKRGAHLALSVERLRAAARRPAAPAHRALGDAAPARGDRPLRLRRRVRSSSSTPAWRRSSTSRSIVPLEDMRELPSTGSLPHPAPADGQEADIGTERELELDLAVDLPRARRARPCAPLDDRLRQQPPPRRAARAAAERTGRKRRSRARTTARSRASSGCRSRRT